ncbi:MAG: class E sortase [Rubrobacteraceae bacterium]
MKQDHFGDWTRVERAAWKRGLASRRRRRRLLALVGSALILFAVVFSLASLRSGGAGDFLADAPKNETLRLSVPKMKRVKNVPVYTAASDNDAALDSGAIHVRGTGFPWENEANVYIAGHRLGYPNTGSFLVFYDLHELNDGDNVVLRDADGRKYQYKVFNEVVAEPDQTSMIEPVAGKNIVSLQACTLPNYSKRLIIQAELVEVLEEPAQASAAR